MQNVGQEQQNTSPRHGAPLMREHLFEKMDEILSVSSLLITAPAGAGKSRLVETYLAGRNIQAVQVTVSSPLSDEKEFLKLLKRELGEESSAAISSGFFPDADGAGGLPDFSSLFKEQHKYLIIDNYERIDVNCRVHDMISSALENGRHDTFRCILISRTGLPKTFIRSQANALIQTLGWKEIRFSEKECQQIVNNITKKNDISGTRHLDTFFDGWITGHILTAQASLQENFELQNVTPIDIESINQYLEDQVLGQLSSRMQSFLLNVSIPSKIDKKIASSISNEENSEEFLSYLHGKNFFLNSVYTGKKQYVLLPFFRAFLTDRLKKKTSKDDFTRILRNTSALLQYSGDRDEALNVLFEHNDWDGAVQVLEANSEFIIKEKGKDRYLQLAGYIPEAILEQSPWIRYWEAECIRKTDLQKCIKILETALCSFENDGDLSGMYLSWVQLVDCYLDLHAGTAPLRDLLDTFKKLSKKYPKFPTQEVQKNCIFALYSIYCIVHPESEDIKNNIPELSIPLSNNIHEKFSFIYGIYLILMGNFERYNLYINSLKSIKNNNKNFKIFFDSLNLFINKNKGNYDLDIVFQEYNKKLPPTTSEIFFDLQKIDHLILSHHFEEANHQIEYINSHIGNNIFLRCCFYILKTKISLHQNNIDQAELFIEICREIGEELDVPFVTFEIDILSAYIESLQGNHHESTEALSRAGSIAGKTKSRLLSYQKEVLRYYLTKNDKSLHKINMLGNKFGYADTVINTNEYLLDISTASLENTKSLGHIQELINKHGVKPDGPALHLENWPWPLKIYTLGRFSVVINGKTIKFSRRAQQKPLSMLKVIIALGGRKIREDLISDALWPDADGDIAHQSFATTLHRLRKLIGHHETIEVQNKLVSLNARMCWVDSWVFERICGQADEVWTRGPKFSREAAAITQQAISLYHGSFLGSESWRPWILPLREKLQSKFIRSIRNLARYHQDRKEWKEAINYYIKGLEVDNLSEDLYRGLMKCYHDIGLCSKALSTYNRCKNPSTPSLKSILRPKQPQYGMIYARIHHIKIIESLHRNFLFN